MASPENDYPPLSVSVILELLAHHHRRTLLSLLIDATDNAVFVDDVIDQLANQEAARTGSHHGSHELAISLYHEHLPKLGQAGLIEVDPTTQLVRYAPNERVESFMQVIEEIEGSR